MRVAAREELEAPRYEIVEGLRVEASAIQGGVSQVSPFVGLLYDPSRVGSLDGVTCPPYDTISSDDRRRLGSASPYNAVRLDLPDEEGESDRYARAAADLERWRSDGVLVPTPEPSYYAYEMRFIFHGARRRVRGVICTVLVEPWGGSIARHEETMTAPIEDRLRLLRATKANLSHIYATCHGPRDEVAEALDRVTSDPPRVAVTDDEGVEHRLWVMRDDPNIADALAGESLVIADGHHRYATALRYREEMGARHGPGPWDLTTMLIVDATREDPPVLPYHRVLVSGAPSFDDARVRDLEEILAAASDEGLVCGVVAHENGELVHRVVDLSGRPPAVVALHETLLDACGGDIWFTHDAVEAEHAVRHREAQAAFFLPATSANRIREVVEHGRLMPRKSTYFWPKPRSGMVIRPLA